MTSVAVLGATGIASFAAMMGEICVSLLKKVSSEMCFCLDQRESGWKKTRYMEGVAGCYLYCPETSLDGSPNKIR